VSPPRRCTKHHPEKGREGHRFFSNTNWDDFTGLLIKNLLPTLKASGTTSNKRYQLESGSLIYYVVLIARVRYTTNTRRYNAQERRREGGTREGMKELARTVGGQAY
jgi:hypothetical protein